jgi:hypothetical protein
MKGQKLLLTDPDGQVPFYSFTRGWGQIQFPKQCCFFRIIDDGHSPEKPVILFVIYHCQNHLELILYNSVAQN